MEREDDLPPAGWYADPWHEAPMRWWDGRSWTSSDSKEGTNQPTPPRLRNEIPRFDPRGLPVAIVAYVGAMVAGLLVGFIGVLVDANDALIVAAASIALYATLLIACRHASMSYGQGSWKRDFGFGVQASDIGIGIGTFWVGAVLANVAASLLARNPQLQGSNAEGLFQVHSGLAVKTVSILVAVVAAPIVEELFFRGLLQRALASQLSAPAAIATQAVLFGFAHVNPQAGLHNVEVVVRITVLGAAFGYIAQDRDSLGPGMVAHATTNIVAVVVNLAI